VTITLTKINPSTHTLTITRANGSTESVELHTSTFFLHDICHYFVEQELHLKNGFWGMLAQGYRMEELKGRENELTEELRQIEVVVGGIQSMYWGHMPLSIFETNVAAIGFRLNARELTEATIPKIAALMDEWKYMPVASAITLRFEA
jgi:hypothetical protein